MPSARQVRSKFETLIEGQSRLIDDLQQEQSTTLRAANDERTPVMDAVRRLAKAELTHADAAFDQFKAPETEAAPALDPGAIWADLAADSATAQREYVELKEFDRGQDQAAAIQARNASQSLANDAERERQRMFRVVEPIIEANKALKRGDKPLIGAETLDEYAGGKPFRFVFDEGYRAIRAAIKEYEHRASFSYGGLQSRGGVATGDLVEDLADYKKAKKAEADANAQLEKDQKWVDAAGVRARMLDEGQIAERVQDAVVERAIDADYVQQLGESFPSAGITETLPNAVKAKALDAVAADLGHQIMVAETTKGSLEKPMSKLRRAGGRSVRVDVDDVAYKVTGQNAMSRLRAGNAAQVRESVRNHQFTDTNSATNMYLLMTVAILASSDNDTYFSASQLEAGKDALDQAGVDLENLSPDVSGIESALADTGIDVADFDLKGIDVGNLHVDVGTGGIDTGVGNIDAGISVTTTFDGGGGGMGGF